MQPPRYLPAAAAALLLLLLLLFSSFVIVFCVISLLVILDSSVGNLQEAKVREVEREAEAGVTFERYSCEEHTDSLWTVTTVVIGPSQPVSPHEQDPSGFRVCTT